MAGVEVEKLRWSDPFLGAIELPGGTMRLAGGFGSGLTRRRGDAPGRVWAVGDRGPNLNAKTAVERYGLVALARLGDVAGAKLMPRPDIGPALAELRIEEDRVALVRRLAISSGAGAAVSGLPIPGGDHLRSEPAFDLDGVPLPPDPGGLDTEGIAALPGGGFWVGDEYGPSLVRLDETGRVVERLVPEGLELDSPYPLSARLPAIAGKRQINRGFEALALSRDGRSLFLAFQSPLAHPDEEAHKRARHVRLWRVDGGSGAFQGQYLYPLDPPESFRRDSAKGRFERDDVKVSELAWAGPDALLVLERGSETTKIYAVRLSDDRLLERGHLDPAARPTVEELSAGEDFPLPVLAKKLLFTSDDHPEVAADLEGMAILSPSELLLVSDNDFGVDGAETSFWRLRFGEAVAT